MKRAFSLTFGLLVTLAAGPVGHAAQVSKMKGTSVLIDSQGDALSVGEMMYAINAAGKKKAIVQVTKIKGQKALGKTMKGAAAPGMSLIPRGGAIAKKGRHGSGGSDSSTGLRRAYWGGMLGYGMDAMNVAVNSSTDNSVLTTASMTGGGISANVLVDYELFKQIWFRGMVGVEQFSVTGPAKCSTGNATVCDAKLIYGDLTLLARYVFTTGGFRPFLGAGLGLLFPASKSSTALSGSSIGSTNVLEIVAGADWSVNHNLYVPISIEYGMLPKSDQVDAHWVALRAGLAFPF